MAAFAMIDAAGHITGFYDDRLHKTLPPGAVALTDEQHQQWLADPHGLLWDLANKALVAAPPRPPKPPASILKFRWKALLHSKPGAAAGKTLLDDAEAWIGQQDAITQLAWSDLASFSRARLNTMAAHFGWTAEQLDQMLIDAAAIEA